MIAADANARLHIYDPEGHILAELKLQARAGLLRSSPDGLRLIALPGYNIPSYTGKAATPTLWGLEHNLIVELKGHVGQVFSARFVGDGAHIVTAGADGTARLWDSVTGELEQTYRGGSRFLIDATLDPDGSMVVGGGADGLLRFWDRTSGRLLWTLRAHLSYVVEIHFEGGDVVTRGFSGDVSRWVLPKAHDVVEACSGGQIADHVADACDIVDR